VRDGGSLWDLFEHDPALFRRVEVGDIPTALLPRAAAQSWLALVTPPEPGVTNGQRSGITDQHSRPRLESIGYFKGPALPFQGGLSPRALQRVRDYIDVHIGETVDLTALASLAGPVAMSLRPGIQAVSRRCAT